MSILKTVKRQFILPLMMDIGIDRIFRDRAQGTLLNLMYHGVVNSNSNYFSPRHIQKEQFEKHLKYLTENFEIISVSEALKRIRSQTKINSKTITLSFDDGFSNNLYVALPLLEKYNVQCTFFVSSICVTNLGNDTLWTELIDTLKYYHGTETIKIGGRTYVNMKDSVNGTSLMEHFKKLQFEERERLISELSTSYNLKEQLLDLPKEIWQLLTKEELIRLSQSNVVEIGSHGHLHYNLGEIESNKVKNELELSKQLLENTIEKEINLIAFPDGSYNESVKELAENAGYIGQLAVSYKLLTDPSDHRILNRHPISSTTTFESNMLSLNKAFSNSSTYR